MGREVPARWAAEAAGHQSTGRQSAGHQGPSPVPWAQQSQQQGLPQPGRWRWAPPPRYGGGGAVAKS